MTTDHAKALSEDALLRPTQVLEEGQSQALKTCLQVMAQSYSYSWGNCLLIETQRPNATHGADFHAWLTASHHYGQLYSGDNKTLTESPAFIHQRATDTPPTISFSPVENV